MNQIFPGLNNAQTSVEGENFYVGDGLLCFENYFIPLSALSMVEFTVSKEKPIINYIIMVICGLFLVIFPFSFFRVIGLSAILMGVLGIVLMTWLNKNRDYYLSLLLNNGKKLYFKHKDKEFLKNVMTVIRNCINKQNVVNFIDMRQGVIEQNIGDVKEMIFNNINSNNTNNGSINIGNTGANIFSGGENSNFSDIIAGDNNEINILTQTEWKQLSDFFEKRKTDFTEEDYKRGICERLERYAKEQKTSKMKSYLKEIGNSVMKSILGGVATRGIIEIIAKVVEK